MNLLLMHSADQTAWYFMPQLVTRVRDFQEKMGCDIPAENLVRSLKHHFVVEQPCLLAIVAVDGNKLHGHVLISLDELADGWTVKILQYQKDEIVPDTLIKEGFKMILDFAQARKANKLLVEVKDEVRARAFEKFGFEFRGILLERKLT